MKNTLVWLGCSSIATLLAVSPAQADTVRELVFTAAGIEDELVDCTCTSADDSDLDAVDAEGDRAIALFGCDCAGCRNLVQQLAQADRLPPE